MSFNLSFLRVATKANTRAEGSTRTSGERAASTRKFPNLTFSVKKGKGKDAEGNEKEVLKSVAKFSKAFFTASGIAQHNVGIEYAINTESKEVFIMTVDGKGTSCNFNEGKSKDGNKSQEFRSNEFEGMLQEAGIVPAELVENFKADLTLTKLDVDVPQYLAVYQVTVAKEGDGDVSATEVEPESVEETIEDDLTVEEVAEEGTQEVSNDAVVETVEEDFV